MTELSLADDERAWLSRWRVGRLPFAEWLATEPPADAARATLVKALDRAGPRTVLARVLGAYPIKLYAENWPRKAAKLAEQARAGGGHPHAEQLQAALVALMYCANCGRPLVDPVSIDRGTGPDCWGKHRPAVEAGHSGADRGAGHASGGVVTSRRNRGREAVPAPSPLDGIEAQLHAQRSVAAPAAAGEEAPAGRELISPMCATTPAFSPAR
jgi:Family of unknown function (DUF6011)